MGGGAGVEEPVTMGLRLVQRHAVQHGEQLWIHRGGCVGHVLEAMVQTDGRRGHQSWLRVEPGTARPGPCQSRCSRRARSLVVELGERVRPSSSSSWRQREVGSSARRCWRVERWQVSEGARGRSERRAYSERCVRRVWPQLGDEQVKV